MPTCCHNWINYWLTSKVIAWKKWYRSQKNRKLMAIRLILCLNLWPRILLAKVESSLAALCVSRSFFISPKEADFTVTAWHTKVLGRTQTYCAVWVVKRVVELYCRTHQYLRDWTLIRFDSHSFSLQSPSTFCVMVVQVLVIRPGEWSIVKLPPKFLIEKRIKISNGFRFEIGGD